MNDFRVASEFDRTRQSCLLSKWGFSPLQYSYRALCQGSWCARQRTLAFLAPVQKIKNTKMILVSIGMRGLKRKDVTKSWVSALLFRREEVRVFIPDWNRFRRFVCKNVHVIATIAANKFLRRLTLVAELFSGENQVNPDVVSAFEPLCSRAAEIDKALTPKEKNMRDVKSRNVFISVF